MANPTTTQTCAVLALGAFALLWTTDSDAASRYASPSTVDSPVVLASCSEDCDKKASDCVDVCEEKFKEDAPRVKCKMACIGDRQKCEKDCK